MKKLMLIVALAATSAALAVDTDAGAIVTDKNLSQYAKVENAANGTATVTIVDTNGTANAVTVYNKSTLDTALAGKMPLMQIDTEATPGSDNLITSSAVVDAMGTAENHAVTDAKGYIDTQLEGYVPSSRTVNGKALSSNITLSAADVGAVAAETDPTALKPAQLKVNGTAMTTASAAVELGGYYIKTVDGKPHLFLRGN